jgi:hypothetical protein
MAWQRLAGLQVALSQLFKGVCILLKILVNGFSGFSEIRSGGDEEGAMAGFQTAGG